MVRTLFSDATSRTWVTYAESDPRGLRSERVRATPRHISHSRFKATQERFQPWSLGIPALQTVHGRFERAANIQVDGSSVYSELISNVFLAASQTRHTAAPIYRCSRLRRLGPFHRQVGDLLGALDLSRSCEKKNKWELTQIEDP